MFGKYISRFPLLQVYCSAGSIHIRCNPPIASYGARFMRIQGGLGLPTPDQECAHSAEGELSLTQTHPKLNFVIRPAGFRPPCL